jgi:hypothetical protein
MLRRAFPRRRGLLGLGSTRGSPGLIFSAFARGGRRVHVVSPVADTLGAPNPGSFASNGIEHAPQISDMSKKELGGLIRSKLVAPKGGRLAPVKGRPKPARGKPSKQFIRIL